MNFIMLGQSFYSGLRFCDVKEDFLKRAELFDFLPNDKYLLIEKAFICGITSKVKVTFIDDLLDSIVITAIDSFGERRKEYHRIILRSFFGEPNAESKTTNVYYDFAGFTAGDYVSYNQNCYIDIRFQRNKS